MTKAQEKAAQVLANKLEAFSRKARTLLGHVRVQDSELLAAFEAGQTADAFAATVASREPVGAAVHAVKAEAMDHAEKNVRERIAKALEELAAADWDVNACAPYPARTLPRYEMDKAKARYYFFHALITADRARPSSYRPGQPYHVIADETRIQRLVNETRAAAAAQYDGFICKMVGKIGPCESAALSGSHVWGDSFLTVTKATGTERWKTQQIVNYSALGNAYYQWPSRKVK